ncbi:hypothetical protein GCM10011352_00780 [Marinobacterium zhoushanense]|uniref:Uncharacterized protein n=1 Tax=Marinobacterium zhoushanense TaxID=1679163 RepID=A0ABQ1JZ22_9GAMM|nr:hypothetical protein GCM10011352_00780 [Marinobacterium zhoushanense]
MVQAQTVTGGYYPRKNAFGGALAVLVALHGRVAGNAGSRTYFCRTVESVQPGVNSQTENTARIIIDAQRGRNYNIWQEVKMGLWTARSTLHEVTEDVGQQGVLECKLIESEI